MAGKFVVPDKKVNLLINPLIITSWTVQDDCNDINNWTEAGGGQAFDFFEVESGKLRFGYNSSPDANNEKYIYYNGNLSAMNFNTGFTMRFCVRIKTPSFRTNLEIMQNYPISIIYDLNGFSCIVQYFEDYSNLDISHDFDDFYNTIHIKVISNKLSLWLNGILKINDIALEYYLNNPKIEFKHSYKSGASSGKFIEASFEYIYFKTDGAVDDPGPAIITPDKFITPDSFKAL